jgi:hypothetical protein
MTHLYCPPQARAAAVAKVRGARFAHTEPHDDETAATAIGSSPEPSPSPPLTGSPA